MSTVGEGLRRARDEQQLSVQDVAELTKMKADHVRALEEGNYDYFAAPVYIRGFVRSYAQAVKLPVDDLMAQLEGELSQTTKFREPPSLIAHPRGPLDAVMFHLSRLDWRRVLIAAAVLGVLFAAVWLVNRSQRRPPNETVTGLGTGMYNSPPSNAAPTLPLPSKSGRK